jgi:hypothetical protein
MKPHKLTKRELIQVIAALRYWGRASEIGFHHPSHHPMVKSRFDQAKILPMTNDELETLIGRLDGSWTEKGLRTWDGHKYL